VLLSPNFQKLVNVPELRIVLLVKEKLFPLKHCVESLILKAVAGLGFNDTFLMMLSLQPDKELTTSLTGNVFI
jgi:hypothetical protein